MTREPVSKVLASAAVLGAVLAGSPAAAAGGRRDLRERLDTAAAEHAPDGDRVGSRRYGTVEAGAGEDERVRLRAGHCYAIVLVVEAGISGTRISVWTSSGELGRGVGLDDGTVVVEACPTATTSATVEVAAEDGEGEYAVGVYELPEGRRTSTTGAPSSADTSTPGGAAGVVSGGAWIVADPQVEYYAGRAFGFQSPIADQVSSTAARPPAEVLGTEAILRRVAWYIKDNPAPVVFLGDAGQVGCRQEVETVFRWLDVSGQPWLFVPGNHDCFPMGSIAPDAVAAIGEAALTTLQDPQRWEEFTSLEDFISGALEPTNLFERWAAACEDPSDPSAGPANKAWLVDRIVEQLNKARSVAPRSDRDYWKEAHTTGGASTSPPGDTLEHWSSWVVQSFPIAGGDAAGQAVAIGLAVDTNDWSDLGEVVGISPGSQGCISTAQIDAAVGLVGEVRRDVGRGDLPVVVFGHHPADHQYGTCGIKLGQLVSRLQPLAYVAAHTHRAAPPQQRELVVDPVEGTTQAVTEYVVGSVVEFGGPDSAPEIERFQVGPAGDIAVDQHAVQVIAASVVGDAPPLDCTDVWTSPASPAETLAYQDALLGIDGRHRWLLLSLDHLQRAGRWSEERTGMTGCQAPSGFCSGVYDEAAMLFDRLSIQPIIGLLTGSSPFASWEDVPTMMRCVRPGLGLESTEPRSTDADLERYVFCTALRAAGSEAGVAVRTPSGSAGN